MSVNGIEITDVIIFPIKKVIEDSKLKAFVKVILNDQFIISGIKVFEGINGFFIRYPEEYNKTAEKSFEVCFPVTAELRNYISDQVLSQYKNIAVP